MIDADILPVIWCIYFGVVDAVQTPHIVAKVAGLFAQRVARDCEELLVLLIDQSTVRLQMAQMHM